MPSLADLFVSYKSVQPRESEAAPARTPTLQSVKSRLQQINDEIEKRQAEIEAAESTEETPSPEGPSEIEQNSPILQWLTEQQENEDADENENSPLQRSDYAPSGFFTPYNRGHLANELQDLFKQQGINVKVTSGKRAAGAAGKAGSRSYHVSGNAVDIIPGDGETFDSIRDKMRGNTAIIQFFHTNGLGVIDETNPDTMARTGATGKHFHIGPDKLAVNTWTKWINGATRNPATKSNAQREWARNTYDAFVKGLRDKYGSRYNGNDYRRVASYMTYQAALESGYGEKANGYNFAGHMRNGKTVHYDTMDDFVKAHLKTLDKWDIMKSHSLEDYVDSLYQGKYRYNASDSPAAYFNAINGTKDRIDAYLGMTARQGGKFANIRQLHEESFGKHWR